MEHARDTVDPWSAARLDDLRRVAGIAQQLFAAAAVAITSIDGAVRYRIGDAADDVPSRQAGVADAAAGNIAIGTLTVYAARQWNGGDEATLGDLATCLHGLVAGRREGTAAAERPAVVAEPGNAAKLDAVPNAAEPPPPFEPDGAPHDITAEGTPAETPARILLADDLDLNRKLISDMLSLDGHAVDSVADGEAAVQFAGEHRYDLILMDMIMPVMDGMAATRAIRALPAPACDVPIVALTAYSLPDQLDNCMKAGVDAVLIKPMSIAALTEAIATWSGRRRAA